MSRGVTKEYYEGRVAFLTKLLMGGLSGKERRQAERELANVRRLMAVKRPDELKRDS